MISGLQRFFDALAERGIRASPAERVDALRALDAVGLADRARVRQALAATLVKHADERATFEEVFEQFFAVPARARRRRAGRGGAPAGDAGERGRGAGRGMRRREMGKGEIGTGEMGTFFFSRRREKKNVPISPVPISPFPISPRTERRGRLRRVDARRRTGDASREGRRPIEELPLRELRRPAAAEERRELARAVRRLVERIRLRAGRRFVRRRSGRPYLRSVFRESLSSAGVPFRIPRRRRRVRTPLVVLLIDVSWSTATAAGLFLSMAGEFLRRGRRTRVVLFVDRPVEATSALDGWLERSCTPPFPELLRSIPGLNLDAPSDYGRLFHALLVSARRPRGRRTLLVVLGDGRTNVFDPLEWAFADLAEGCGGALWLVPEPLALWGTGDSALPDYARHVDTVVEAADLAGLARGVAALVRRL